MSTIYGGQSWRHKTDCRTSLGFRVVEYTVLQPLVLHLKDLSSLMLCRRRIASSFLCLCSPWWSATMTSLSTCRCSGRYASYLVPRSVIASVQKHLPGRGGTCKHYH